jgi:flagella basal body P-ring formation protein FlgA
MKQLASVLVMLAFLSDASADADRLCQAARSAVEQLAAARGWHAEVRCRGVIGRPFVVGSVVQAAEPPQGATLRSGPTTWVVHIQPPGTAAYVQRVPLAIAWTGPAWVSRRDLAPGEPLRDDDVELQSRRWPDGLAVSDAPPAGRLRHAVRAGDIVTAAQLLPADARVRGDRVAAVLAEGAMEIRMPAQLLTAARVGERTRVQVNGRPVALDGLLADAQTVKVDSP